WCDGSKLVLCKSGAISSSKTCSNGCESMPAGTDDKCKSGGTTGFCSGKVNGYWCNGDVLTLCKSSAVSTTQACAKGCQSNPPGTDDACKSDGGTSGGFSLCQPFKPAKPVTCAFGCYSGHKGSDYAAPSGTPVYAPMSGTAVLVRKTVPGQTCALSFGNYVKIANGDWSVILAHMSQDIPIVQGQTVKAGQQVGKVSNTGYTLTKKNGAWVCKQGGGHHLHLELRKGGTPVNAQTAVNWSSTCDGKPAPTGPCTGKEDGKWCAGNALLTCKSGQISQTQLCAAGCQTEAAGTPDHCKSTTQGFCSGKKDGAWCDGSSLRICKSAAIVSTSVCPAGCASMPAGVPDVCKQAANWCTGKKNGAWCKGSVRVSCWAGAVVQEALCKDGCDGAAGAALCQKTGSKDLCAAKSDGHWCDNGGLRLCGGGITQGLSACTFGCLSNGHKSTCKPAPATTDPCAKLADGAWCDGAVLRQCAAGQTQSASTCAQGCIGGAGNASCATPGGGDFCQGKKSTAWCDGVKLVNCAGGVTDSVQLCPFGCAPTGDNNPDSCIAAAASPCQTIGAGMVCSGDTLVHCQGGNVSSQTHCSDGCVEATAKQPAFCKSGAGFCTGKLAGKWCNGFILTTCVGGEVAAQSACLAGCTVTPGPVADVCTKQGDFCAGKEDGLSCEGPYRVQCSGEKEVARALCAFGCVGQDGKATCSEVGTQLCDTGPDGARCIGSKLVDCQGGEAVSAAHCVNGCTLDPASGPQCVIAGSGAPGQIAVTEGDTGCFSVVGSRVVQVQPQNQLIHDAQLGQCTDRSIAVDGGLITSLSMVYATLNKPRDVLGVKGNTPPLENVWRTQQQGYRSCGGSEADVCCVRWSKQPQDVGFTWISGAGCLSKTAAMTAASALVSHVPVVVGGHTQGEATQWRLLIGVNAHGWVFIDPKGGGVIDASGETPDPFVVDVLAIPFIDSTATGLIRDETGRAMTDQELPGGITTAPAPIDSPDTSGIKATPAPTQSSDDGGCSATPLARRHPIGWIGLICVVVALLVRRRRAHEVQVPVSGSP
ncbi:MAG: M23 family metallopeptidase, partial [Myxococcales bacterium]|nr:M23 family metallopeptidase [Myxococcales bacterium]